MKTIPAMVLALASMVVAAAEPPSGRPNVLWLTAEDISPNLGCYGDAYAVTPVLDRLAAEGVRYSKCFGITGVCAPNRSCLITGVYPWRLGSHGMRSLTRLPPEVVCFSERMRRAGYYCVNNAKTDYNFPVPAEAWDECSGKAHWKNRPAGKPFFAVFNHEISHEGQIRAPQATREKRRAALPPEQRRDPAKAPVPPYHPDTPEVRADWAQYYENISSMDGQIGEKLRDLEAAGLAEDTLVFFFGDNGAGMPGVKKWVWEDGLHVPLIVRVPAKWKHLAPGAPGTVTDRLVSFVDFAPTVLSLAGAEIPAAMQGVAFLGPGAGSPREFVFAGRDRMAERFDCVRVVRDGRFQYLRNFMPHLSWSQFVSYTEEMPTMQAWRRLAENGGLAGPAARYFEPTKPAEELYDCIADPRQVRNLATDPAHRATLERMRARCEAWMVETRDLGLLPEREMEIRAAASTPWAIAADPAKNPLPALIAAARLASARDPAHVSALRTLLDHEDPALRWWGAAGLGHLGGGAAAAAPDLGKALGDTSWDVRLAAADALCAMGRSSEAVPVFREALRHESAFVRLAALNGIDRLGAAARPFLADIAAAKTDGRGHVAGYVNRMVEYLPAQIRAR